MSDLPLDVFISPGWAKHHEERSTGLYDGAEKIRYLRADLTCGECAKHGKHTECAHDYFTHDAVDEAARRHVWPNHGVPACMAFLPKTEEIR